MTEADKQLEDNLIIHDFTRKSNDKSFIVPITPVVKFAAKYILKGLLIAVDFIRKRT
jgi:hypothetical protein